MSDLGGKSVFLSGPVSDPVRECEWNRFLAAERTCLRMWAKFVFNPMERIAAYLTHEEAMHWWLDDGVIPNQMQIRFEEE